MPATELKRGTIKKSRNAQRLHQDFKHALYVISDVQNSVTHPTTMEATMRFAHLNTLCALEHNQLLNNLRTGH